VIPLHDLTEARRTTETATAEQIFDGGYQRGVDDERAKVLDLLAAQEFEVESELERDTIWLLRQIVKSGGHWQDRP
jgi:hypothetical protein